MRILYFDCFSGIAGDMAVAALLDLGVPETVVLDGLEKTGLSDEFSVCIDKTVKNGIQAVRFDVRLHEHDHLHHHGRTMGDIRMILENSELGSSVKDIALRIFEHIANAEGKVHGLPPDKVHFHEVGAVDSIVDIVAFALCMDYLKPDSVLVSELREGSGFIECQHGIIPVPAPATLQILSSAGAVITQTAIKGEMITPTGAGILAATANGFGVPCPSGTVTGVGYGGGHKDFEHPNVLRAVLVEESAKENGDIVCVLETMIDDSTGEQMGFVMETLLETGAKDVYFSPVYAKKSRPAVCLTVLCAPDDEDKMVETVFKHTSTIGIRRALSERHIMRRECFEVNTEYGSVQMKKCCWGEIEKQYPEYESVKKAAKAHGVSMDEVLALLPGKNKGGIIDEE